MASKKKLLRFAELATFENVYQNFEFVKPQLIAKDNAKIDLQGTWSSKHFKNNKAITLELACGGGEYTLALAKMYPERNFIGVDIKGARIYKGARKAREQGLENVAFLRTKIELIHHFFAPQEVSEIWITFPDPFLKDKKENRRLTAPPFLDKYRKILTSDNIIHLKTDSGPLYEFSNEVLELYPHANIITASPDIYSVEGISEELKIKTFYELKNISNSLSIRYIKFSCTVE